MRHFATVAGLAILVAGMSACSEKSQQKTQDAAGSVASDVEAASNDVAAAAERAADDISAKADRLGEHSAATADHAGRKIEKGADDAADATGAALENAGKSLRDH